MSKIQHTDDGLCGFSAPGGAHVLRGDALIIALKVKTEKPLPQFPQEGITRRYLPFPSLFLIMINLILKLYSRPLLIY